MISNRIILFALTVSVLLTVGCGSPEQERLDAVTATNNAQQQATDTGQATATETTENEAEEEHGDYNAASARTIPQNLKDNPNLSTFFAAARQTDILTILSKTGPYTVLVPSDEAFEALPGGTLETLMKPENKQQLTDLLSNHIIAGKLDEAALQHETNIKTIGNGKLKVMRNEERAMINGAEVLRAGLESRNGVMHIVDKVLMPEKKEEQ